MPSNIKIPPYIAGLKARVLRPNRIKIPGNYYSDFWAGRCKELRPSLDKNSPTYWTELGQAPMVEFGISKGGKTNPDEIETDIVFDTTKFRASSTGY